MRAYAHRDPLVMLRDRALVEFALQTALRPLEAARFNAGDLDDEAHTLHIPHPAKGGLVRTIPLDRAFMSPTGAMMSWMRARPRVPNDPEAVWIGLANGRPPQRMNEKKLGKRLQDIGKECSVRANWTRMRHTRATELLRSGMHIRYLQLYLGHAEISSTMVYLEAGDDDLEREFRRRRR